MWRSFFARTQNSSCRRWLVRPQRARRNTGASDTLDLQLALEYLAAEYEVTGRVCERHLEAMAGRLWNLTGHARAEWQSRLAAELMGSAPGKSYLALALAARFPVPHARAALLEMLTQEHVSHWRPDRAVAARSHNVQCAAGSDGSLDLRPMVIAALGQLRDPSLLGVFHQLLSKLSAGPEANGPLVAAVQEALSCLAPGPQQATGYGSDLSAGRDTAVHPAAPQAAEPPDPAASERRDLLAGFGS